GAEGRGGRAVADRESAIEMQRLRAPAALVAGGEIEQNTVRAAAGVARDAEPVECHFDACPDEALVRGDLPRVLQRDFRDPRCGRGEEAERVGRVLPRL